MAGGFKIVDLSSPPRDRSRRQTPGPLIAPLAGVSASRRRSLRHDLSVTTSSTARILRPARRPRLATPSPLLRKTIAGAVAIEDIRVGDLVLSQDPNTGELAFQPVLQTSQRSPEPLLKVRLARRSTDTLEGSGGHPLWVAGEGWVKLRDLKSGTWQEMLD